MAGEASLSAHGWLPLGDQVLNRPAASGGPGPDLDRPMNPQLRDESALPVHTQDRAARALTYT